MTLTTRTSVLRARIGADGSLISADGPILALQQEAGGDVGTPFAVPQLAAVARLVLRIKMPIARSITAAAERGQIEMWARAQPDGDGAELSIVDWAERGEDVQTGIRSSRDSDVLNVAEGLPWFVDAALRFRMVWEADEISIPTPSVGTRFTAYFRLEADSDGDLALLSGVAQRQPFSNQLAVSLSKPEHCFWLSGYPTFDLSGQLLGYRGRARLVDERKESLGSEGSEIVSLYPAGFGKRLDRSLRQPLGRIIANADSMGAQLEGPLRPDYTGYAHDIASAGRHLMGLVDDLADLQAIDRPDFAVASEEVDLADLARRAIGLLAVKALDKKIRVYGPDAETSVLAVGEFRRVLQILVNLIGNALRYSPEETIVRVEAVVSNGMATIDVIDQGEGVPMDSRERIFEKFERLGRDDPGGSGLGLYISRRLARAMGGDIVVEGDEAGACFRLSLPAL